MLIRYFLFKHRIPLYQRALDTYVLRQSTIARNIANVTTPRYRPQRVRFEEELRKVKELIPGKRTHIRHFPVGSAAQGQILPERADRPIPRPEVFFSGDAHVNRISCQSDSFPAGFSIDAAAFSRIEHSNPGNGTVAQNQ